MHRGAGELPGTGAGAGLRVGLVCPYSLDVPGGVQNHVLGLARALTGRGHDVAVLAPGERDGRTDGRTRDRTSGPLPTYVTTTGRSLPLPHNGSVARVCFGPRAAGRVRRWLADGDFDLVHVHEPAAPSLSLLALWSARGPVVATHHTAQDLGSALRRWALGASAATVLRPGPTIAAHVAVSTAAARTLAAYSPVEPVLVPNGIDRRVQARGAEVVLDNPGPRAPALLFIGRLDEPRKGLRVLLAALPALAERHPGVRLTVLGPGRPPLLEAAVAGRVRFLGAVGDQAKAAALARSDVLVAPNTGGESFGIVLAEAMAAGTAVAASDLAPFREVLGDGRFGMLFRTGDPTALASAVDRLLSSPGLRREVALRALAASAAFDWSRVAERLERVYDEVLASRPGGSPRRRLGPSHPHPDGTIVSTGPRA